RIRLADCALHSPAQQRASSFPYTAAYVDDEPLAEVFDLATNEPTWIPAALVALSDEHGALATSSGLAASPSVVTALLRGLQEVVERDAFMATWLHQLGGREVSTPSLGAELAPFGAAVQAFDLTPAFSPHPVALVAASIPHRGAPRPSIGLACRATWDDAVEKAFLECCQGTVFVGHTLTTRPALRTLAPADVVGFDEHAVYYGANPDRWDEVPLRRFAVPARPPSPSAASGSTNGDQLVELVAALQAAGAWPCYRELTTVDAAQLRVRVVRVVVPELTPLHHDHRWPFLGGRTADVTWRYPDAPDRTGDRRFPSPHPHALG
ncbi:MAG: YcaO-like family protein, partial [Ilumatobacteraceae bacterium]